MHWSERLAEEEWAEGRIITLPAQSYRHAVTVACYAQGRQRAKFANGEHNYGAYVELLTATGERNAAGSGIVPVLPDGRLLMVVEQRPAQGPCKGRGGILTDKGRWLDLSKFGPYSSLEFPGGAKDSPETIRSSALRELVEETGVQDQKAELFLREHPIYPMGSDMSLANTYGVIFLQAMEFQDYVRTDGGLVVLALTTDSIQKNIWSGVISSGSGALLPWNFYREVMEIKRFPDLMETLVNTRYMSIHRVNIVR